MTTVWRLQVNTSYKEGQCIGKYLLDNDIMAIGWSFRDSHIDGDIKENLDIAKKERYLIKDIEGYTNFCKKYNIFFYKGKINGNVRRFTQDIKLGDLIWMRYDGIYYLARFNSDSKVIYNCTDDTLDKDACIQITNVNWQKIGDESDVPGAVTTAFIAGFTISRIHQEGVEGFSEFIYDKMAGTNYYGDTKLTFNQVNFYNFISPTDCEDLLCMYLNKEYGYVVIPSTNKKSTELYECVLLDPKTGKNIFIQVKKGNDKNNKIDVRDYLHLDGDVYLLSTSGNIDNYEEGKYENIKIVDPEELFNYIIDNKFQNYLPQSIKYWIELLGGYDKN